MQTTATGAWAGASFHAPFGDRWHSEGSLATDRRYTGQRSFEASLGSLYHYQARWYSPVLGRFLSPDPLVPAPGNPQAFNRYSYVYNNPFIYVDPSGYAVVKGYYRDHNAPDQLWYGWYDDQEDPPSYRGRGIRLIARGLKRPLASGRFELCFDVICSTWLEYETNIEGASWGMKHVGGQLCSAPCVLRPMTIP